MESDQKKKVSPELESEELELDSQEADDEQEGDEDAQPAGLRGEEELDLIYAQRSASDEEQEEEPEAEEVERVDRRNYSLKGGKYRDAQDVIMGDVKERIPRMNEHLKAQLKGSVLLDMSDSKKNYLLSEAAGGLGVREVPAKEKVSADCTIRLSESDLIKVALGDLNPQVAMLSDKIKVEGRLGLAVYFFNLVAPSMS